MSSHREAPEISKDPVADNCDVYAFVSPDHPSTVTILTNFIPLQGPAGGPNFYEFGDDVLYHIYIDNDGDGMPEIEYQFQFTSTRQNDDTFLYNTGPIGSLDRPELERPTDVPRRCGSTARPKKHGGTAVAAAEGDGQSDALDANTAPPGGPGPAFPNGPFTSRVLVTNAPCPPCNIGPRSTPNYEQNLAGPADPGRGQRASGLRRPAGRAVLRRPRLDLRPRRTASVQHGAPDPARELERRRCDQGAQHPHDRDPGPDREC